MITPKEHAEILAEYEALIDQAWGRVQFEGSLRMDPALGRNLEWLRDSYVELWEKFQQIAPSL